MRQRDEKITVMVPDACALPTSPGRRVTGAKPLPVNAFLALALMLIGACATLPAPPEPLQFSVAGRVGAVAGSEGGRADFIWRQYPSGFEIEFWGPLGQGRTRLIVAGESLSVRTARGERVIDDQARDWIRRELRLELPIAALSSWINGRPAAAWSATGVGTDGFDQLGWRIEVAAWGDWQGRRQPRKLTLSKADYRVTIICREWRFGTQ